MCSGHPVCNGQRCRGGCCDRPRHNRARDNRARDNRAATSALFDFADEAAVQGWGTIDDRVMGGVSSSTTLWVAGSLLFAGEVSTDNNGGFSSALSAPDDSLGPLAADATGIRISAHGDGKTYVASTSSTSRSDRSR